MEDNFVGNSFSVRMHRAIWSYTFGVNFKTPLYSYAHDFGTIYFFLCRVWRNEKKEKNYGRKKSIISFFFQIFGSFRITRIKKPYDVYTGKIEKRFEPYNYCRYDWLPERNAWRNHHIVLSSRTHYLYTEEKKKIRIIVKPIASSLCSRI